MQQEPLSQKTKLSNDGMTDDGTGLAEGKPASQGRRRGVHHLAAVTHCWHVVGGRSWEEEEEEEETVFVSLAGESSPHGEEAGV